VSVAGRHRDGDAGSAAWQAAFPIDVVAEHLQNLRDFF
jgi:hypothetical protein